MFTVTKITKNLCRFLQVFTLGILVNCASTSTLQTARTTPENEYRIVGGVGLVQMNTLGRAIATRKIATGSGATLYERFPIGEVMVRQGLSSSVDWGMRYTTIGSADLDLKFLLLGESCKEITKRFKNKKTKQITVRKIRECPREGFAMALGLGGGYAYVKLVHWVNAALPIYISYDFSPEFALYFAPRYLWQHDLKGGGSFNVVGTSVGLKIGDKTGILLEGGYFVSLTPKLTNFQANIGYFF